MIIDTHAHYDDEAFDKDREKLLDSMQNRGIEYIVNVGASIASCKTTVGLTRRFPNVYGALGVHPDEVASLTDEDFDWLKHAIYKPKIVAVGEIGLDYHWNDNRDEQIAWFEKQMELAREAELDLVKIAPNAKPPVCKIIDYGKYRYELARKEKEAKKKQKTIDVKEVRLSPNIDKNDLNTKINQARKFLSKGDKVKVTLRFRGRELAHVNSSKVILEEFAEQLSDVAVVDKQPKFEGRSMIMFLTEKR